MIKHFDGTESRKRRFVRLVCFPSSVFQFRQYNSKRNDIHMNRHGDLSHINDRVGIHCSVI